MSTAPYPTPQQVFQMQFESVRRDEVVGVLLAFFHTKEAAPHAVHSRYNIVGGESLDLEPRGDLRLQRIFNNRHMENLFHGFSSLKFFLARDNVRELLAIR